MWSSELVLGRGGEKGQAPGGGTLGRAEGLPLCLAHHPEQPPVSRGPSSKLLPELGQGDRTVRARQYTLLSSLRRLRNQSRATLRTLPTPGSIVFSPRPACTVLEARPTKPSTNRSLHGEDRNEQRLADPFHRWFRAEPGLESRSV